MYKYDESEQIRKTSYEYDAARRLAQVDFDTDGDNDPDETVSYEYDAGGLRTKLTLPGDLSITYAYNGDGNRIQQDALKYILDLQPGLPQILGDSDGKRYVHSIRGIQSVNDGSDWTYPITDALGSVRGYVDASNNILSTVNYSEWGVPNENIIGPAFTGEWRDANTLQHHRKRYLNPALGIFPSLDPFEGTPQRPMSLNGYSWVEGDPVNSADPSGECVQDEVCRRLSRAGAPWSILQDLGCLQSPAMPLLPMDEGRSYPVGIGLRTPVIIDPARYGTCSSAREGDRPACAVQTYLAAVDDVELRNYGANGETLLWELFFALIISGEGSIFYINPDLPQNAHFELEFRPDATTFRLAFESAIYRQLIAACGGPACTEADFVKYLGGPPHNQWGIQAFYQASTPDGNVDMARLKGTAIVPFRHFIDNAQERMDGNVINTINWGNPTSWEQINAASYVASYIDAAATYGQVNPNNLARVYAIVR